MKQFVTLLASMTLVLGCVTESTHTGLLPPDSGAGLGTGGTGTPGAGTSGVGIDRPGATGGEPWRFWRPKPRLEVTSGSQTNSSRE